MKKLLLLALLVCPWAAWGASGDSCNFVANGTTQTIGTALPVNIPLPSAGATAPEISCRVLCDVTASGAFSCGPMWVPGGGTKVRNAIIRVLQGSGANGCGYDDTNVYTLSNINTSTGAELPSLGLLDDDGSSGGVKQIEHFGPLGPYIYVAGTAGTGGTCNGSNHLLIQLLLYFENGQR